MKRILRFLKGAGLAAVLAGVAAPVQGILITQSHTFSTGGVITGAPIGALGVTVADSREAGGLLPFDFFDATLGTLDSAKWVLSDAASAFDLDHRAQITPAPPGPPVNVIVVFSLDAHGGVLGTVGVGGLRGTGGLSFNLGVGQDSGCFLGPVAPPIGLLGSPGCNQHTGGVNSVALDSLNAANLASLTGVGTFDQEVRSLLEWSTRVDAGLASLLNPPPAPLLGPGPADVGGEFQLRGTLQLIYDYTPAVDPPPTDAPLPATPLLLAAGFLALCAMRRREVTPWSGATQQNYGDKT